MFSCEFCEISENSFFTEQLRATDFVWKSFFAEYLWGAAFEKERHATEKQPFVGVLQKSYSQKFRKNSKKTPAPEPIF